MEIGPNKTAKLTYTLTLAENGNLVEKVNADKPATFKFGINQLLPAFETKLNGLKKGEEFSFKITADEAYGPVDPYAIFDIPKETFEVEGKLDEKMLSVRNLIPMTDNEGNKHLGRIVAVLDKVVTMDFNHQLAGKDLQFTGTIIEVTEN